MTNCDIICLFKKWGIKMNFKDIFEFNDLIDQLDDCLMWYEKSNVEDVRYRMYMSNGEAINIEFSKQSIPHLLGIDINYLRSTGIYKGSPYSILEDIIENPNRLYGQFKSKNMEPELVFSKHIYKKLNNFKKVCGINIFNIEFIVNYKSHNSYITGEQKLDGDYYIATKIDDDTLSIVGLKENGNLHKPQTNIELDKNDPDSEKFLSQLLTNQILTSVQSLKRTRFTDYELEEKSFHYYNDQKEEKLKTLEEYAKKYNCHIATNKDCIFYVQKTNNLYAEKNSILQVLAEITEQMQQGKEISSQELETQYGETVNRFKNMIHLYNFTLNNSSKSKSGEAYLNLAQELESKKDEVLHLQKLLKTLEEKQGQMTEKIHELEDENKELKNREEAIKNILIRK